MNGLDQHTLRFLSVTQIALGVYLSSSHYIERAMTIITQVDWTCGVVLIKQKSSLCQKK